MSLSRSSLALQFSIEELIRRCRSHCGFYLITCRDSLSWKEYSLRHSYMLQLMRVAARDRYIPRFGGVRVFEEGETTFRAHAHWVMTPRMSQARIQHYSDRAGLGHVWLDPRPASVYLGMYLSKYLSKNRGSLHGVRRWSCFGEFSSVKVYDVVVDSPEINLFRENFALAKEKGLHGAEAYTFAVKRSNQMKFGLADSLDQGLTNPDIPHAPATYSTVVLKDGTVKRN